MAKVLWFCLHCLRRFETRSVKRGIRCPHCGSLSVCVVTQLSASKSAEIMRRFSEREALLERLFSQDARGRLRS